MVASEKSWHMAKITTKSHKSCRCYHWYFMYSRNRGSLSVLGDWSLYLCNILENHQLCPTLTYPLWPFFFFFLFFFFFFFCPSKMTIARRKRWIDGSLTKSLPLLHSNQTRSSKWFISKTTTLPFYVISSFCNVSLPNSLDHK